MPVSYPGDLTVGPGAEVVVANRGADTLARLELKDSSRPQMIGEESPLVLGANS